MNSKILLLFFISAGALLSQDWSKAISPEIIQNGFGYSLNDLAQTVVIDDNDNVYVGGYFNGRIVFDNDTLTSKGLNDVFIVKYDSDGNILWANSAGGSRADYVFDMVADPNGGCFVVGYFSDILELDNINLSSQGNSDGFVAKIDDGGNWLWAKSFGGSGYDRAVGIAIDQSRNIIITGRFENTSDFGSTQLSTSGSRDVFIAKLDHLGNWTWAKKGGGTSVDEGVSIGTDANNNIYVTGFFNNTCTFGTKTITSSGDEDIFIVKTNTSGDFLWAKSIGGSGEENVTDLIIDQSNSDIYLTGSFEGSFSVGSTLLTSNGGTDVLLVKMDSDGNFTWANSLGGSKFDKGSALALNGTSLSLTGLFQQSVQIEGTQYYAIGGIDLFITEVDVNQNFTNFRTAGSNLYDASNGIAVNSTGEIYTIGFTYGNIDFGTYTVSTRGNSDGFFVKQYSNYNWAWAQNISAVMNFSEISDIISDEDGNKYFTGLFYGEIKLGSTTLTSIGDSDIMVVKLDKDDNYIWAVQAGGLFSDKGSAIDIDDNGNVYIAGNFFQEADFSSINIDAKNIEDAFIAKLDSDGNWQWAKPAGGLYSDLGNGVAVDPDGNIFFTGSFFDKIYFDSNKLDGNGFDDIFVAKLDNSGNWLWYKNAGGINFDYPSGIKTDSVGNAFVYGGFDGDADFGTITVTSQGNDDGFIAKISAGGNFQWVATMGGSSWFDKVRGFNIYSGDKLMICGSFTNLSNFGTIQIPSQGDSDAFIAELNSSGEWQWVKSIGGSGLDLAYDIDFDANDKMYLTGVFSETVQFGSESKTSAGMKDVFLSQMDLSGNFEWTAIGGGNYDENSFAVTVTDPGISYVAGSFHGIASFDINVLTNISNLDRNAFIAKSEFRPLPDWTFKANTGRNSNIIIPDTVLPKFNGNAVDFGDAIGAFFMKNGQLECAGYSIWESDGLDITVWGDDYSTLEKDGYSNGEKYQLKIWDSQTDTDYIVGARYRNGNKTFQDQSSSYIHSLPASWDSLLIPLGNGWNLFSSYSRPDEPNMEIVFDDFSSNILLIKDNKGKIYVPQFNINTIGDFKITEAYQIYAPQAFDYKMAGEFQKPEQINISLSVGWNLLPYLRDNEMSVVDAFSNIVDNVLIVKNNDGKIYVPQFFINTIGNMVPTKGYQIYVTSPVVLTYPEN